MGGLWARIFERGIPIACGLVPLAGMLFFGWGRAEVIFILYLDAYLATLRLVPANMLVLERERTDQAEDAPAVRHIGNFILACFFWPFLSFPVMVAYKPLHDLVSEFHPGGLASLASDYLFQAPGWLALVACCRLLHVGCEFAAVRSAEPSRFGHLLKSQYAVLLCKGVVLFALAVFSPLLGAAVFVWSAVLGLIGIELYVGYWLDKRSLPQSPRKAIPVIHTFDGRNPRG